MSGLLLSFVTWCADVKRLGLAWLLHLCRQIGAACAAPSVVACPSSCPTGQQITTAGTCQPWCACMRTTGLTGWPDVQSMQSG